jgi:hypothetical protein
MSDLKKTTYDDMYTDDMYTDDDYINEGHAYHEDESNQPVDNQIRFKKPKFKFKKKAVSFLMAFIMLLTSINTDRLFAKAATTVTNEGSVSFNGHTTGKYKVTYSSSTHRVFCIQKAKSGPSTGATVTVQQYTGTTTAGKNVLRALYYYYQIEHPCGGTTETSKDIVIMHLILDHYVSGTAINDSYAIAYKNKIEATDYVAYSGNFTITNSSTTNKASTKVTLDGTVYYRTAYLYLNATDSNLKISLKVPSGWNLKYNNICYGEGETVTIANNKAFYFFCNGKKSKSATVTLTGEAAVTAYRFNTSSDSVQDLAGSWGTTTGKTATLSLSYTPVSTATPTPTVTPTPMTGSVTVKKSSNGVDLLDGSDSAKELDGTTFALYYNASKAPDVKYRANDNYSRTVTSANGSSLVGYFVVNDGLITAKTGASNLISDDGTAFVNLPLGYYELIETKVPSGKGYTLAQTHSFKLTAQNTSEIYTIDVTEPKEGDPVEITIEKENGSGTDGKSLAYTVFEVDYWEGGDENSFTDGSTPTHVWYIQTLADSLYEKTTTYKAKLENKYLLPSWNGNDSSETKSINDSSWDLFEAGKRLLDGAVSIKEVQAADGFNKDSGTVTDGNNEFSDRVYRATIKDGVLTSIYSTDSDSDKAVVTNELTIGITNDEYRGDLGFTKINSDGDTLSNVDFNLSLLDDNGNVVETKEITTDENGNFNSADDSELWFYNSSDESSYDTDKVNKDLGSLITGATYRLTELECDANITYGITDSFTFTMPTKEELENGTYDVKVATASTSGVSYDVYLKAYLDYGAEHSDGKTYKDRVVATLYFKDSKGVTKNGLVNEYVQLSTTATDVNTESHVGVVGKTTLSDTVSYNGTRSGVTYEVVTKLKLDDGTALTDSDGNEITQTNVFTTDGTTGTYTITQDIDADDLGGRSVVFYEYLYLLTYSNNTKEDLDLGEDTTDTEDTDSTDTEETVTETFVGKHESLDFVLQTVYFPKITTALNFTSGSDYQYEGSATSFTDTVEVTNLVTGSNYKVKSVIYDKTAGTLYVSDDGETYLGTATLTAGENYKATADVDFLVNTLGLGDHELVCYEYLYYVKSDGTEILVNAEEDIENMAQTKVITALPKLPNTGSRTGLIVNTLAVLIIGIGLYLTFRKRTVEQLGTHRFFGRKTGK